MTDRQNETTNDVFAADYLSHSIRSSSQEHDEEYFWEHCEVGKGVDAAGDKEAGAGAGDEEDIWDDMGYNEINAEDDGKEYYEEETLEYAEQDAA